MKQEHIGWCVAAGIGAILLWKFSTDSTPKTSTPNASFNGWGNATGTITNSSGTISGGPSVAQIQQNYWSNLKTFSANCKSYLEWLNDKKAAGSGSIISNFMPPSIPMQTTINNLYTYGTTLNKQLPGSNYPVYFEAPAGFPGVSGYLNPVNLFEATNPVFTIAAFV